MEENKNESTLSIIWYGNERGKKSQTLYVHVGDQTIGPLSYEESCQYELPITRQSMPIKIEADNGKRKGSCLNRTFQFEQGKSYCCELIGTPTSKLGMGIRMSEPDAEVDDDNPICRNDSIIAMWSFICPVFGIYSAIKSHYNRASAIAGGSIGFVMGAIALALTTPEKLKENGFAFAILDIIINLLVGGFSAFRGLMRGFLDMLF